CALTSGCLSAWPLRLLLRHATPAARARAMRPGRTPRQAMPNSRKTPNSPTKPPPPRRSTQNSTAAMPLPAKRATPPPLKSRPTLPPSRPRRRQPTAN
ncbi:MAG: hypothetical protein AVDCRST_MAG23-1059, partial [uncultured Sphingosinicella sp.]